MIHKQQITCQIKRKVRLDPPRHTDWGTLVNYEWRTFEVTGLVTIDIDLDGLAKQLGRQAACNRSRKSVEASGLIEARIKISGDKEAP